MRCVPVRVLHRGTLEAAAPWCRLLEVLLVGIISAALVGVFAVAWTLLLLIAMNGFSERQAMPVLAVHAITTLAALVAAGFGAASFARHMAAGRGIGAGLGFVSVLLGGGAGSVAVALISIVVMVMMSTR